MIWVSSRLITIRSIVSLAGGGATAPVPGLAGSAYESCLIPSPVPPPEASVGSCSADACCAISSRRPGAPACGRPNSGAKVGPSSKRSGVGSSQLPEPGSPGSGGLTGGAFCSGIMLNAGGASPPPAPSPEDELFGSGGTPSSTGGPVGWGSVDGGAGSESSMVGGTKAGPPPRLPDD